MKKIVLLLLAVVIQLSACVEDGDMTDVEVWKEPIRSFLSADVETVEFEAEASSVTIHVTSIYSWSVSCPSWCSTEKAGDGQSLTIVASGNTSLTERKGDVIISDVYGNKLTIGIVQKGVKQRDPSSSDNQPPS